MAHKMTLILEVREKLVELLLNALALAFEHARDQGR
jgi:hypothetical protein